MKNNKGYTLVELMVSAAIFGIVSLGIAAFIIGGMRMYNDINSSIRLQNAAQLLQNQISEYVVDCEEGIAWDNTEGVKTLYVANKDKVHVFRFVRASSHEEVGILYYGSTGKSEMVDHDSVAVNILAEHIEEFFLEFQGAEDTGAEGVILTLAMERNGKEYDAKQFIALRNKPSFSVSWSSLWEMIK